MELPKTISANLEFEVAKLKIEKNTIKCKENKACKKIIRLTTKYILRLMKCYTEAEIYFNGTKFEIKDKE